jgi:hypothetical protein
MGMRMAAFMAKREVKKEYKKELAVGEMAKQDALKKFDIDVKPYKTQLNAYRADLDLEIATNSAFSEHLNTNPGLLNSLDSIKKNCDALEDLTESTSEQYSKLRVKQVTEDRQLDKEMKEFRKEQQRQKENFFEEVSVGEFFASMFGFASSKTMDKLAENRRKEKEMQKKFYRHQLDKYEALKDLDDEFEKKKKKIVAKIEPKLDEDNEKSFKKDFEKTKQLVAARHQQNDQQQQNQNRDDARQNSQNHDSHEQDNQQTNAQKLDKLKAELPNLQALEAEYKEQLKTETDPDRKQAILKNLLETQQKISKYNAEISILENQNQQQTNQQDNTQANDNQNNQQDELEARLEELKKLAKRYTELYNEETDANKKKKILDMLNTTKEKIDETKQQIDDLEQQQDNTQDGQNNPQPNNQDNQHDNTQDNQNSQPNNSQNKDGVDDDDREP